MFTPIQQPQQFGQDSICQAEDITINDYTAECSVSNDGQVFLDYTIMSASGIPEHIRLNVSYFIGYIHPGSATFNVEHVDGTQSIKVTYVYIDSNGDVLMDDISLLLAYELGELVLTVKEDGRIEARYYVYVIELDNGMKQLGLLRIEDSPIKPVVPQDGISG